jgi:tellurite resistance protein TehA-like permease
MDTGILSIILKLLPYHFTGQSVLATILFVFNIAIFALLSLLSIYRLIQHRTHVISQTLNNAEELSYLGAPPTAYLTLVAQISLTCSTSWGFSWTIAAYVFWWIGLVWTVGLTSFTFIVLAKRNIAEDRTLSPAIFLPLISVMTLGTTGGILVNYSQGMTPGMAIPLIVVAYMAIGYALFLSLMYYAFIAHKLIAVGLPAPAKIPALMITVGPMGQFATAVQVLSTAANTRGLFGAYNEGVWLKSNAASSVSAVAVLLALFTLGFAFMWITISWYIVIERAVKRDLPFGLTWWSLIFPMGKSVLVSFLMYLLMRLIGVFTTALLNLSIALNSAALRGLTAALLIFLFIIYFGNWAGTVWRMWQGVALGIPQQREEEDQQAREKKERMDQYIVRNGSASGHMSGNNV